MGSLHPLFVDRSPAPLLVERPFPFPVNDDGCRLQNGSRWIVVTLLPANKLSRREAVGAVWWGPSQCLGSPCRLELSHLLCL